MQKEFDFGLPFSSSDTERVEKNEQNIKVYKRSTSELKTIIKQAENSGKAAWTAGKLLKSLKDDELYKINYNSFPKFLDNEFNIKETTAYTYIKIFEKFSNKEIKNLILSKLIAICDIEDNNLRSKIVKILSNEDNDAVNVKDVITAISLIDQSKQRYREEDLRTILKNSFLRSIDERKNEKQKRKNLVVFGDTIKSEIFEDVVKVFEKEPINEMGVVGLFCILFEKLRTTPFELDRNILYFKSIKYIQVSFPDACVICRVDNKKQTNTDLQIEFEYKSSGYIEHNHHKSSKKCDLIICWEDNLRANKNKVKGAGNIKNLPPIIELKNVLNTGKIILIR